MCVCVLLFWRKIITLQRVENPGRFRSISPLEIARHRFQLKAQGFTIIRQITTHHGLDELNKFVVFGEREDAVQGFRKHGTQATASVVDSFHRDLSILLRYILGAVTKPTYAFAMEYDELSVLPKHLELVTNEISMTLCFYRNAEGPLFFDRRWQENK